MTKMLVIKDNRRLPYHQLKSQRLSLLSLYVIKAARMFVYPTSPMCQTAPLPTSCLITNDLLVFNLKTPFTKRYQPISMGWYLSEACHKLHPEWLLIKMTISLDANLQLLLLMSSMICSFNLTEDFNINNYTTFSDLDIRSFTSLKFEHAFAKSMSNSFRHFYFFQPPIYGTRSHLSTLTLHLTQSDPPLLSSFGPTLTPPITALITTSSAHASNACIISFHQLHYLNNNYTVPHP